MVICFECTADIKDQLDQLMRVGKYRNYSEAISIALANQLLLQSRVTAQDHVLDTESQKSKAVFPSAASDQGKLGHESRKKLPQFDPDDLSRYGIPDIFATCPVSTAGPIAPNSDEVGSVDATVTQSDWIFGQHNKLLPAKASCRALANLLPGSDGLDIDATAVRIANEAAYLGLHFVMLERRHQRSRDYLFSTAFPGNANPDKGRIRYANQFVAAISKQGKISGLLVDLKFVNRLPNRGNKIALTEAGWAFGLLRNPLLDDQIENPEHRFSEGETNFLLDHIIKSVPVERFAYTAILQAISARQDTPEKLRVALASLERSNGQVSASFFANQRSGAISRMADLNLLIRDRDGVRVKYLVTDLGQKFLHSAKKI